MTTDDTLPKKRSRSSQLSQNPPLMSDAMKKYAHDSPSTDIAEDSDTIMQYKRVNRNLF